MLNEDDYNELIVMNERIYQVFSQEEKNEVIQHELSRTGEHWNYMMFKLGFYNVESDYVMNDILLARLFLTIIFMGIGMMFLNELKFILWNIYDMFSARPAVIQRYRLNRAR